MNTQESLLDPQASANKYVAMEIKVVHECLRQAHWSFNFALVLTSASISVSLLGIGLVLSDKISEGAAMTAGGLGSNIVNVRFLKLSKEASDRLCKIARSYKVKA